MSSTPSPIDRFMTNMQGFTLAFEEILTDAQKKGVSVIHPTIVKLGVLFINNFDKSVVINNFINHSWKLWDKIFARDEEFFHERAYEIFGALPIVESEGRVDGFKKLFKAKDEKGEYILTQDDRDLLWEYWHAFVRIAIDYVHLSRKPASVVGPDGKRAVMYKQGFMNEIDLNHHCQVWGIKLQFP